MDKLLKKKKRERERDVHERMFYEKTMQQAQRLYHRRRCPPRGLFPLETHGGRGNKYLSF